MPDIKTQPYIYGETFTEQEPHPSQVVYEILSSHLIQDGTDKAESHLALNDVYKALNSSEQAADLVLNKLEQEGLISREDGLILIVLLAVSRTLGPDLDFLRQAIITANFSPEEIKARVAQSGLDKITIDYLQSVVNKIRAV